MFGFFVKTIINNEAKSTIIRNLLQNKGHEKSGFNCSH